MRDSLTIRAAAIARAIRACDGKRITQEAANAAAKAELKALAPDELELAGELITVFLNLSALNQDLERHGLVQTERSKPAIIAAVEKALES